MKRVDKERPFPAGHRHDADAGLCISGAIVGAAFGSAGGPPGAVAGALIGTAVGALAGAAPELHTLEMADAEESVEDDVDFAPVRVGIPRPRGRRHRRPRAYPPSNVARGAPAAIATARRDR